MKFWLVFMCTNLLERNLFHQGTNQKLMFALLPFRHFQQFIFLLRENIIHKMWFSAGAHPQTRSFRWVMVLCYKLNGRKLVCDLYWWQLTFILPHCFYVT